MRYNVTFVDTFGVYNDVPACYEEINSAMGAEYADVSWLNDCVPDTTFERAPLWVSALDLSPDESTLVVGTLTAGWGGPLGGAGFFHAYGRLEEPYDIVGNWHNVDGSGEGVTDGPRGAAFDADGNLYLSDFYSNAIYHYGHDGSFISDGGSILEIRTMIGNKIMMLTNKHLIITEPF